MKLYDLDKLIRDSKQNGLYNLFEPTFIGVVGINLKTHVVSSEQEMRMDLVCKEVYGSVDHVDLLLHVNDIDNPLNIMEDDILVYPSVTAESEYRVSIVDNSDNRAKLLNPNKSTKKDDNRRKYVEENYSLPPTFLQTPTAAVKIENGQIVIGG